METTPQVWQIVRTLPPHSKQFVPDGPQHPAQPIARWPSIRFLPGSPRTQQYDLDSRPSDSDSD
jgi:hypothetical protein